ncbi:MAG TPA: sugar phosphate isomerase/epimerase [Flavisolibacter sp.]|jgi:sugar phosphate isomerase/epimerase|nr:sugar phosphate isomerase/epimerase [Flavisolibacter sp.]
MTSRRSFIKSASILSASALVSPQLFAFKKPSLIGLQLYTVRDAMQKDPSGTLARVAHIGYNSVEGATYTGDERFYGMRPKEFAAILAKNNLVMPSSHYRLGQDKINGQADKGTMLNDWDRAVDDASQVGVKYMVCAWLSPEERKGGADHYKRLAEELNKAGRRCKKNGIQLCYHNHDFEFESQGKELAYDIILNNSDKNLVKMEIDLYWVTKAGHNPVELFDKHPGRFPLWHVKDMDNTSKHFFTEVGNGVIDFKKIFRHANKAGMKYFFVEQDECPGSPFDSITKSIRYIKSNLV